MFFCNDLERISPSPPSQIARKWDYPSQLRTSSNPFARLSRADLAFIPTLVGEADPTPTRLPLPVAALNRRWQLHPARILLRRGEHSLDELHPLDPLLHAWHQQSRLHRCAPLVPRRNLLRQVRIELRKRLQVSLRMPGRNPARVFRRWCGPRPSPADCHRSLAILRKLQIVRIFLSPL